MVKLTLKKYDHYANLLPSIGGDLGEYVAKESRKILPAKSDEEQRRFSREQIGQVVGTVGTYVAQNGTLAYLVSSTGLPVVSSVGAQIVFWAPAAVRLYHKMIDSKGRR